MTGGQPQFQLIHKIKTTYLMLQKLHVRNTVCNELYFKKIQNVLTHFQNKYKARLKIRRLK